MQKLPFLRFTLLVVATLLCVSTGLMPARAAEVTIGCTVQELFDATVNANSGDIINLSPGCVYNLTEGYDPINNPTAGLYLTITLTYNGNGATIQRDADPATSDFRLFYLEPSADLTLNNVTLHNGQINGGGAIVNAGGRLEINASTLSNNKANGGGGGGAINNYNGGTLIVDNSTFMNNEADYSGGAIYNSGDDSIVTVTNSTFIGNTSVNGGAISNDYQNGVVTVINGSFVHNLASNVGGAIYNGTGGGLTITKSAFTDNIATSQGGAVTQESGTVATVTESTFHYNFAYFGGAISLAGAGTVLNIVGSTVADNGGSYGGGIWNYDGATLNVDASAFYVNMIDQIGGAIANDNSTLTVTNSTLWHNSAENGGGIANYNRGTVTVNNSTIFGNEAISGGGLLNTSGTFSLKSSIIADNFRADLGGEFASLGHNIIEDTTGATFTGATATDLTNAAASPLNIGSMGINGGPTQTMALGAGSIAIGYGDCAGVLTDQRGYPRKTPCDVGAFETQPAVVPPVDTSSGGTSSTTQSGGAETTQCANSAGSLSVPGGGIYCRIIARDGKFLASPAEIGIQSIIDLGVIQAINLVGMLPNGVAVTQFTAPVGLCVNGTGDVLFVSANDPNRTVQRLAATTVGNQTCFSVPGPGLVVLVGSRSGIVEPLTTPATGTVLTDCRVTTTDAPINLRAEPNTGAVVMNKLPYALTLTATERVPGWYKVIYLNGQGWISERFVSTLGACG